MHHCNDECQRQFNYGYNCGLGCTNWDKPDPPWDERPFHQIEPDPDDDARLACHSSRYREGWKKAKQNKLKLCTPEQSIAFGKTAQDWMNNHWQGKGFWQIESRRAIAEYLANQQGLTRYEA